MACSSCSRNRRKSNDLGCRRALQSARWPSCHPVWNDCGCASCGNGCASCGNECGRCRNSDCGRCGCRETACARRAEGGCGARCADGWGRCRGYDGCAPFYNGPCGPAEGSCGNHCVNHCGCACECCGQRGDPVYGFFTQVGTIDVNAGGSIPFNGGSTVEGIWKDGGELTLDSAGVYLVTLSADIPENVTLYTTLDVRVNGATTPGGRLTIDKDAADGPLMVNTQTMITVNEGAAVSVTSEEPVSFSTSSASQPIITLSLVKIS